ncbi:MAG: entericidin A/B family lipoprotein [Arenimonas sp.]
MKKLATVLLTLSFVLALAACNTIEGVGKDVQKAGEKVEEAAKN